MLGTDDAWCGQYRNVGCARGGPAAGEGGWLLRRVGEPHTAPGQCGCLPGPGSPPSECDPLSPLHPPGTVWYVAARGLQGPMEALGKESRLHGHGEGGGVLTGPQGGDLCRCQAREFGRKHTYTCRVDGLSALSPALGPARPVPPRPAQLGSARRVDDVIPLVCAILIVSRS